MVAAMVLLLMPIGRKARMKTEANRGLCAYEFWIDSENRISWDELPVIELVTGREGDTKEPYVDLIVIREGILTLLYANRDSKSIQLVETEEGDGPTPEKLAKARKVLTLKMSVKDMRGIPEKTRVCLSMEGIHIVEDLVQRTEKNVSAIKGIGAGALNHIRHALNRHGLKFKRNWWEKEEETKDEQSA